MGFNPNVKGFKALFGALSGTKFTAGNVYGTIKGSKSYFKGLTESELNRFNDNVKFMVDNYKYGRGGFEAGLSTMISDAASALKKGENVSYKSIFDEVDSWAQDLRKELANHIDNTGRQGFSGFSTSGNITKGTGARVATDEAVNIYSNTSVKDWGPNSKGIDINIEKTKRRVEMDQAIETADLRKQQDYVDTATGRISMEDRRKISGFINDSNVDYNNIELDKDFWIKLGDIAEQRNQRKLYAYAKDEQKRSLANSVRSTDSAEAAVGETNGSNGRNWVRYAVGAATGGGLVLALSDRGGQQTNAQLYGQQPLY